MNQVICLTKEYLLHLLVSTACRWLKLFLMCLGVVILQSRCGVDFDSRFDQVVFFQRESILHTWHIRPTWDFHMSPVSYEFHNYTLDVYKIFVLSRGGSLCWKSRNWTLMITFETDKRERREDYEGSRNVLSFGIAYLHLPPSKT